MPRIDLNVPFSEKDEAKQLGARWDGEMRTWYIPDGKSSMPFKKWLPELPYINIKAGNYYIVESSTLCWKCGESTRVFAFLLPEGHETLEAIEDDSMEFESDEVYEAWVNSPESSEWQVSDMLTIIHYVRYLPREVLARIAALTPNYRIDYSKTTESSYFMNHCEYCGMKQGDFQLHCEPQGAFVPLYEEDVADMILHPVNEAFAAEDGGYSYGVEFFDFMHRV